MKCRNLVWVCVFLWKLFSILEVIMLMLCLWMLWVVMYLCVFFIIMFMLIGCSMFWMYWVICVVIFFWIWKWCVYVLIMWVSLLMFIILFVGR